MPSPNTHTVQPTASGGLIVEGDTDFGKYRVEWNADGLLVSQTVKLPAPGATPAEVEARLAAEGYDPSTLRKGGCCDPPAANLSTGE